MSFINQNLIKQKNLLTSFGVRLKKLRLARLVLISKLSKQ